MSPTKEAIEGVVMNKDGFCDECGLSQRVYEDAMKLMRVEQERDALKAAIESWKKEEQSWQDDMKELRAALKQYTDGDECSVDGAPDANNANHGETCRYCKAMSLLGWPGFER